MNTDEKDISNLNNNSLLHVTRFGVSSVMRLYIHFISPYSGLIGGLLLLAMIFMSSKRLL